jgi:hypothetical protein
LSCGDLFSVVQLDEFNCRPTARRFPFQMSGIFVRPPKMIVPCLGSRVDNRHGFTVFGIDGRRVRPFSIVAERTCKRKVFGFRFSTAGLRNRVIDVKIRDLPPHWEAAVFAAEAGPSLNGGPGRGADNAHISDTPATSSWSRRRATSAWSFSSVRSSV